MEVEKVLLVGDGHGDIKFYRSVMKVAEKYSCPIIIQLGDFGYWEHTAEGKLFLQQMETSLEAYGVQMMFLDGNHDNHPMLWNKYHTEAQYDTIEIRKNLFYVQRGARWEMNGVKFVAMGGAYSIDKSHRIKAMAKGDEEQWWSTEQITDSNVIVASMDGDADIMLAHDCFFGVHIPTHMGSGAIIETMPNREKLYDIVVNVRPKMFIHGHFHHYYHTTKVLPYQGGPKFEVEVIGLASNIQGDQRAWKVLDLEKFKNWKA